MKEGATIAAGLLIAAPPCSRRAAEEPAAWPDSRCFSFRCSLFDLDLLSLRERVGGVKNHLILAKSCRDLDLRPIIVADLDRRQLLPGRGARLRPATPLHGRAGHWRAESSKSRGWNRQMYEGILTRQQLVVGVEHIDLYVQGAVGDIDRVGVAHDGAGELLVWSSVRSHHDAIPVAYCAGIDLGDRNEETQLVRRRHVEQLRPGRIAVPA